MAEQKFTVNIPVIITDNQINDIMITATEGGVNYWCDALDVVAEPTRDKEEFGHIDYMKHCTYVILAGGSVLFHDAEDEEEVEENPDKYTLTLDKLLAGITKMFEKHAEGYHPHFSLENYDAEDADCIIQYALFGELVYG